MQQPGLNRSLLLVDSDPATLRVLEVSLRQEGFTVVTASTGGTAFHLALHELPDVAIVGSELPDEDSHLLIRRLREDLRTASVAIIFLSSDPNAKNKMRAINAGVDDFLTKPVILSEILSRVQFRLEHTPAERGTTSDTPGRMQGSLSHLGITDLLQIMAAGQKNGDLQIVNTGVDLSGCGKPKRGRISFCHGSIFDAKLEKFRGLEAIYRMLLFREGTFAMEFRPVSERDLVNTATDSVLLEGMRRLDEWARLTAKIPPLETRLSLDFDALGKLPILPDRVRSVLNLFNGERTISQVLEDGPLDVFSALGVVHKSFAQGLILEKRVEPVLLTKPKTKPPGRVAAPLSGTSEIPKTRSSGAAPGPPEESTQPELLEVFPGEQETEDVSVPINPGGPVTPGASVQPNPQTPPLVPFQTKDAQAAPAPTQSPPASSGVQAAAPQAQAAVPASTDVAPAAHDTEPGPQSSAPDAVAQAHGSQVTLATAQPETDNAIPGPQNLESTPAAAKPGAALKGGDSAPAHGGAKAPRSVSEIFNDGDRSEERMSVAESGGSFRFARIPGLFFILVVISIAGATFWSEELFPRPEPLTNTLVSEEALRALPGPLGRHQGATLETKEEAKRLLNQAESLMAKGQHQEARRGLQAAVLLDPKNATARAAYAELLLHLEQPKPAEVEAEYAIQLNPEETRAHFVVAMIAIQRKSWTRAKKSYHRVRTLEPNGTWAKKLKSSLSRRNIGRSRN